VSQVVGLHTVAALLAESPERVRVL